MGEGSCTTMAFRIDREITTRGTRLQTYIAVPFERLLARFGEPRAGDGVNTIHQWVFSDDGGNVFTIYDWKATTMVDRNKLAPGKLRELAEFRWNIGSSPGLSADWFKQWLIDETIAKSPDVAVKRREQLNTCFYKYDCDQLGFLEAAQMRSFIRKMATKFRRSVSEHFVESALSNFCEIDANGHGKVHQNEFVNYFLTQYEEVPEDAFLTALFQCTAPTNTADTALRSLFWKLDHDGSGFIGVDVLKEVVGGLAQECELMLPESEPLEEHLLQFENVSRNRIVSEEEFQTIIFEIFAAVDQELFLHAVGYYRFPFAGARETILANLFQRHNRETMQANQFRDLLLRYASRQSEAIPSDESLDQVLEKFSGISEGQGLITEEEFVAYFNEEMRETNDTDFFTTMQFFWHGYLNYY